MEIVCTLADVLKQRGLSRRAVAREAGAKPSWKFVSGASFSCTNGELANAW